MSIFDDLLAPLKDITEMATEFRNDVMESVGEIVSAGEELKDQGQAAIEGLTTTVDSAVKSGKDLIGK